MIAKDSPILTVNNELVPADDLQPGDELVSIYGSTFVLAKSYDVKELRRIMIDTYPYLYCSEDQQFLVKTEDGYNHQSIKVGDFVVCLLTKENLHTMILREVHEIIVTSPVEMVKIHLKGDSIILAHSEIIIKS